jgi:hypothetical protein
MYPGDPVTHAFWSELNIDGQGTATYPADRRFVMATGPFSMQPGGTQNVTLAVVWSRGQDHLDSVRKLREDMTIIRNATDEVLTPRLPEVEPDPPERYELGFSDNYPDPFRETTTIQYSVSDAAPVRLVVYDVLGREVAVLVSARQEAGRYEVEIDGSSWVLGLYVYHLEIGRASATRTMVRLP